MYVRAWRGPMRARVRAVLHACVTLLDSSCARSARRRGGRLSLNIAANSFLGMQVPRETTRQQFPESLPLNALHGNPTDADVMWACLGQGVSPQ
jgi:hypothetical protein